MTFDVNVPNDLNLHHSKITFETQAKYAVTVRAVWQDNLPSGSALGTIVAIHGSPGSHNDFKYIANYLGDTGIRFIGINFPGHGYTDNHKRIAFHNADRNAFLQAMIDHLRLTKNTIFIGHSRGTENALNICVLNADKARGLVLINPTGLRMHKGIKPFFIIQFASWIYNVNLLSLQKAIMHPILYNIYNHLVKLRTKSGKIAAVCVQTMETSSLGAQREYIERINENTNIKVLLTYSGKDFLIEEDISREMATVYRDTEELVIEDSQSPDAENKALRWIQNRLPTTKTTAVCFRQDGHFLQKYKARFLAESLKCMFEND